MSDWYAINAGDTEPRLVRGGAAGLGIATSGGAHVWMRVAETTLEVAVVSTTFYGLDPRPLPSPPPPVPPLFSTTVLGGRLHGRGSRSSTWNRAVARHDKVVQLARLYEPTLRSWAVRTLRRLRRLFR